MTTNKSKDVTYDNKHYSKLIFTNFNQYREKEICCDVTIKIQDQSFPAHRIVLISSSNFFKRLFTSKVAITNNQKIIEIAEIKAVPFRIILKYFYTGILTINANNVFDVLKVAEFLELTWPMKKCFEFFQKILNNSNCLNIWKSGSRWKELQIEAEKAIFMNLNEIVKSEEFLDLSQEEIQDLLKGERKITNENSVFTAMITWIKHDETNRKLVLSKLLKNIKTENISKEFFEVNIRKEPLIRENSLYVDWLLDISNQISKEKPITIKENAQRSTTSLKKSSFKETIFISFYTDTTCYIYDIELAQSNFLTKRPDIDKYCQVAYKGSIYMIGGEYPNNTRRHKTPYYKINSNYWGTISLNCDRIKHGACVLNNNIYIIGGYRVPNTNTFQRYDFSTSRLINQPPLASERSFPGVSTHGQTIYVNACSGSLCLLERFDIREGKWHTLPSIPNTSLKPCVSAIINDDLYYTQRFTNIVEKFNITKNSWEIGSVKNLPIKAGSLISAKNKLYCVSGNAILNYNAGKNDWNEVFRSNWNEPNPIVFNL